MEKLYEVEPTKALWRGTVVKIRKWFKCPSGYYDYDFMLIDGGRIDIKPSFDVICINHDAGARNILTPLEADVQNCLAITAGHLFNKTLDFLNIIKGKKEAFTKDEVKDHLFVYNIRDIKEIHPDTTPFFGGEKYNDA